MNRSLCKLTIHYIIIICLQDALACYSQSGTSPLQHVFCFLDMGLPQKAADRAAAYIKEDANLSEILAPAQVHAGEMINCELKL